MSTPAAQAVEDGQIALLSCGPAEHAVTDLGRRTAELAVRQGFSGSVGYEPDPARLPDLVAGLPEKVRAVGLQLSDWIYGRVGGAAAVIGAAAEILAERGARFVLTLHDLPRPGPDGLFQSRAAVYRDLAARAGTVLVCSRYEQDLLAALGADSNCCAVLPLPVDIDPEAGAGSAARPGSGRDGRVDGARGADGERRAHDDGETGGGPTVGIFGFLYPGKGHREVIEAMAGTGVTVMALGRPSDGQEYLVEQLGQLARECRVEFRVTGYLPAFQVPGHLRRVDVPVCPHTEISASASINAWIGAGRRPIVADGRYARELAGRMPGALALVRPDELRSAVLAALDAPARTWWPAGTPVGPTSAEVAARYLAVLRGALP